MAEPLISVILTTRARHDSLRRCLESIGRCSVPSGWIAEVLVVDNECSDETRAVVDSSSAGASSMAFRYLCEPRRGKAFAVNRGATAAKGSIYAFTDDDVIVDSDWLREIVAAFEREPGLALIAGRVDPFNREGRAVAVTRASERRALDRSLSLEGLVLGCNLAIRREVLQRVRGRDTRIGPGRGLSCEDIDFTYRVLDSGHHGAFLPGPTVYHEPGERDRQKEYLRGKGAFYLKFVLCGDRNVSRQAWWQLRRIAADFASGNRSSALKDAWQMTVGACIMATRMLVARRPYG